MIMFTLDVGIIESPVQYMIMSLMVFRDSHEYVYDGDGVSTESYEDVQQFHVLVRCAVSRNKHIDLLNPTMEF